MKENKVVLPPPSPPPITAEIVERKEGLWHPVQVIAAVVNELTFVNRDYS